MHADELITMFMPIAQEHPEDSAMRRELLRTLSELLRLSITSRASLFATQAAVEALQEVQEVMQETSLIITEEEGGILYYSSEVDEDCGELANSLVAELDCTQDPHDN